MLGSWRSPRSGDPFLKLSLHMQIFDICRPRFIAARLCSLGFESVAVAKSVRLRTRSLNAGCARMQ